MGKASRKKTLHLGVKPIGGPVMKSRRVARKVTTQFHTLNQQKNLIQANSNLSQSEKQRQLAEIDRKIEEIGGINKYQEASVISTKHFSTSKWIVQAIKRLHSNYNEHMNERFNTFEVGAINTQLQSASFLKVRAIDLHSQHAKIEECDFFDVVPEKSYDVIVCSMVINYVSQPIKRGEMLGR
jgi:25S rRNA (adenine2142-N1)-methyltransferase